MNGKGIKIVPKPDEDPMFDDLEEFQAIYDGVDTAYVRESEWPTIKAHLEQIPRLQ